MLVWDWFCECVCLVHFVVCVLFDVFVLVLLVLLRCVVIGFVFCCGLCVFSERVFAFGVYLFCVL